MDMMIHQGLPLKREALKTKIIPVFLPHQGCPGQCIFCNQQEVTGGEVINSPADIYPLIQRYLATMKPRDKRKRVEVAFYGGNFTGLPPGRQSEFLSPAWLALGEGQIDGLRISTRPDYICESNLRFLADYGVTTIELGVQSLATEVLKRSGRNYSEQQVAEAVTLIHNYQFCLGLHLMIGLPEDTETRLWETVEKTIQLSPHFVRLHPTLVIKNTGLERLYRQGEYSPLTLVQAVQVCQKIAMRFSQAGIPVARIGLQPIPGMQGSGMIVAGPFHPAFGELVASALAYDRMSEVLRKDGHRARKITIFVPQPEISVFLGQGRDNLKRLGQEYSDKEISIRQDDNLSSGLIKYLISV